MRARNSLLRVARPCRSKVFAAARVICFMRVLPIFTYASDQYAANLFSLSLGISKRGDTYLRTLLVHGARSVLSHSREPGAWIEQLTKRRHRNVAIVAIANKMARTIWAILAHGKPYEKNYAGKVV